MIVSVCQVNFPLQSPGVKVIACLPKLLSGVLSRVPVSGSGRDFQGFLFSDNDLHSLAEQRPEFGKMQEEQRNVL